MNDITFLDFDTGSRTRIKQNQIALNNKKGNYSITFNQWVTKIVQEKGYNKLRIGVNNLTGSIYLVLNHEKGLRLLLTGKESSNIICSSIQMVQYLVDKLNLDKDKPRHIVDISENLSQSEEYLTFEVKQR